MRLEKKIIPDNFVLDWTKLASIIVHLLTQLTSKFVYTETHMRRLFSFNMTSLDGFFEGPDRDINWHNVDDEFNQFAIDQLQEVDTLLFGRVTYELMASYWPTSEALTDDPVIATLMNNLLKIVISRTLNKSEWQNTRLVNDNIAEEITRLKEQPGRDIALFGSANLMATLMKLDLIDEHRLMVNPLILGSGTSLFQGVGGRQDLKLLKVRTFASGNVLLYYQPAGR
jgi:dihydrofolate reductase